MGMLDNLRGKLTSLYSSRREHVDSLRENIVERDLEIGNQADLLERYSSENSNYVRKILKLEERTNYLDTKVGDLEKSLELQRNSAGHLKMGKRVAERRFSSSKDFSLNLINRLVEEGYHPLEGERNGRYAFIDSEGVMTSFSKKAQKIFGYEPGETKYEDMISESAMEDLVNVMEEAVLERLPIRISEKEIILKNVRVKPLYFEDVYVGTLLDFEEIGRVEKFRKMLKERKEKKQEEEISKVKKNVKKVIEDTLKKLGHKSL